MGKEPEEIKHSNSQQIYEKVLNITSHQRNANQTPSGNITLQLLVCLLSKKKKKKNPQENTHWWGCGGKGSPVHGWWGCKSVQPMEDSPEVPQKLKIEPRNHLAVPFLGTELKGTKSASQRETAQPGLLLRSHNSQAFKTTSAHQQKNGQRSRVYALGVTQPWWRRKSFLSQ